MGNQFHLACWRRDIEKVKTWTSSKIGNPFYTKRGVFGAHALHIAVYRGYMDIISLLTNFYIPLNELSYCNIINPLMEEVAEHTQGNKDIIIQYLNMLRIKSIEWYRFGLLQVHKPQSVHELNQQSKPFIGLFLLVRHPNFENIVYLCILKNGLNSPLPGYPSHITPLRLAVIAKRVGFVKYLLSRGANHTITDGNGNTVLHIAARMGTVDVVQCLLDAGSSLSAVNEDSFTPFSSAALCGSLPIITAMIKSPQFNISNVKLELAMQIIVAENHFHIMSSLVRLGVNVSTVHSSLEDSFPMLHIASFDGSLSTVTKLLECGADVQSTTSSMQQTALHFAANSGTTDMIRPLISAGLSINKKDNRGNTAGDLAIFRCEMNFLSVLIEAGYDVNQTVGRFYDGNYLHVITCMMHTFHPKNFYKPTVHHLRALVSMGCDMHLADKFGRLPIHVAAILNLGEAITCLVDCGCAVDVPDSITSEGMQPIHFAALYDSVKAIESLSRLDANFNARCSKRKLLPIHLAIFSRSFKACFKLLELGASPIVSQFDGLTPMHLAALHTSTELIDVLADCGCSVNINSDQDSEVVPRWYRPLHPFDPSLCSHAFKPIHIAVAVKNVVALRKLLTLGAEVDAVCFNATPLHLASAIGFVEGVDVLLNFNANADQRGPGGFTRLDSVHSPCLLATSPHRCGADKDKPGPNGFTPLHLATLYGHTEVVQLLLSHNCNTELVTMEENNHGCLTPLHLASLLHCPEIVELLLQHNQKVVNSLTANGLSALHLSLLPPDVVMKHLLLSDSEIVIAPPSKEELASHRSQQSAVVSLLLDHGCDVNTVSTSGYTAYDFAKMCGFDHIFPILHKAGGKDRVTLAIQEQEKQHNMEMQVIKDQLEAVKHWKEATEQKIQDLQSERTHYSTMWDVMKSEMDAVKRHCLQSLSAPFHRGMFRSCTPHMYTCTCTHTLYTLAYPHTRISTHTGHVYMYMHNLQCMCIYIHR